MTDAVAIIADTTRSQALAIIVPRQIPWLERVLFKMNDMMENFFWGTLLPRWKFSLFVFIITVFMALTAPAVYRHGSDIDALKKESVIVNLMIDTFSRWSTSVDDWMHGADRKMTALAEADALRQQQMVAMGEQILAMKASLDAEHTARIAAERRAENLVAQASRSDRRAAAAAKNAQIARENAVIAVNCLKFGHCGK